MWKWKNSLLAAVMAAGALIQTGAAENAAERPSSDVRRVAHHLACKCGCSDTVATCAMLECGFSNPAKLRIAKLQSQGMSDQAIIDQFVAEYGPDIYRGEPNAFGWAIPYASVGAGLFLLVWFVRRYRRPKELPVLDTGLDLDDPALAKYREQIEKDLAHLD
jgi:cytochrome c-type biogenesis protein CcmH